jgi:hypothetical protein
MNIGTQEIIAIGVTSVGAIGIITYYVWDYVKFVRRYRELQATPLYETEDCIVYGSGLRDRCHGGYQWFSPKKK